MLLYPRWRLRCRRENYNLRRCRRRHVNRRRRRAAVRDGSVNPVTDWREATAAANGLAQSLSHLYSCPSSKLLLLRRRYGAQDFIVVIISTASRIDWKKKMKNNVLIQYNNTVIIQVQNNIVRTYYLDYVICSRAPTAWNYYNDTQWHSTGDIHSRHCLEIFFVLKTGLYYIYGLRHIIATTAEQRRPTLAHGH